MWIEIRRSNYQVESMAVKVRGPADILSEIDIGEEGHEGGGMVVGRIINVYIEVSCDEEGVWRGGEYGKLSLKF